MEAAGSMSGVVWLSFAIVSICFGAIGQVLLKLGVTRTRFGLSKLTSPSAICHVLIDGYVLTGLVLFSVSLILWLAVIGGKQLSGIYPMVSLAYVAVALMSVRLFGDTLSPLKICGIGIIIIGVCVLTLQPNESPRKATVLTAGEKAMTQ
jgi:drug/metabolite transporter (DMT)-like permease